MGGGSSDKETTEAAPDSEAKAPLDTLLRFLKDEHETRVPALIADLKSADASGHRRRREPRD